MIKAKKYYPSFPLTFCSLESCHIATPKIKGVSKITSCVYKEKSNMWKNVNTEENYMLHS
jgi:hypothetical protein